MRLQHKQRNAGFTLVELVIVIVVVGILSAYAVVRSSSPAEVTLPSQAQTLASDIRHAQALAYTSGKPVRFTLTGGSCITSYCYGACASASPGSCGTSCADFQVSLQKGVTLTVSPSTSTPLYFNSLGQPLAPTTCTPLSGTTTYTLTSAPSTKTVSVAPLTGFVTVSK